MRVRSVACGTGIAVASHVAIMWDPRGGALRRKDKPTEGPMQESISIGASVLAALVALKLTPTTAGSDPSDAPALGPSGRPLVTADCR